MATYLPGRSPDDFWPLADAWLPGQPVPNPCYYGVHTWGCFVGEDIPGGRLIRHEPRAEAIPPTLPDTVPPADLPK